jgi:ribosomal protein L29
MQTSPPPADPVAFLASLTPEEIEERLAELDRQARALRVLLRSARARQRQPERHPALRKQVAAAHA